MCCNCRLAKFMCICRVCSYLPAEEEIRSAKNFLIRQYAGHKGTEEATEGAYYNIIIKSYQYQKKTKINLKTKLLKELTNPRHG